MSDRDPGNIIGEAPAFLAALEHVSQAAGLAKPVLVIGERGTGKELFASRVHFLSPRWEQPMVKVNCAALTESLLESELFGHEAGAFTGAVRTHIGRFEQADGGTLVLDELATIPLRMQEKILRVIEYGEYQRVGGSATLTCDVRVVGATNQDLPVLATQGQFRPDLLDRLAFDVIYVPPLRARSEDILTLAYHFAVNMSAELKRPLFAGFSAAAASSLLNYGWPGNVRELKNTVERSVYRSADGATIKQINFDPFASPFRPNTAQAQAQENADERTAEPVDPPPENLLEFPVDFKGLVKEFEISVLEDAMIDANLNQRVAAELLGLSYHQLRASLKKHDLLDSLGRGSRGETRQR
jgi:psp operon transcriptional activator